MPPPFLIGPPEPGDAALHLGCSVETLVSIHVGALHDDDQIADSWSDRMARAGPTKGRATNIPTRNQPQRYRTRHSA